MPISSDDIRNVAIVGHRGVGKTALLEAMLYLARAIPKMGQSGAWASGLDGSPEEHAHLATLESRVVSLQWGGKKINLIDTPGESNFYGQTRVALAAADAAILLVSAKDGIQSGAEWLFRWVREARLPCLLVLTRIDDDRARFDEVLAEIRARLDVHADLMEVPEGVGARYHGLIVVESGKEWPAPEAPGAGPSGTIPEELRDAVQQVRARLVDDVAATDDALTEQYLEQGDLSREDLDSAVRSAVSSAQLLPLFICSPVRPSGVAALLDAIVDILPSPRAAGRAETDGVVSAFVLKTHLDPHAGRTSWVRLFAGHLHRDSQLLNASNGELERVGQLLEPAGTGLQPTTGAAPGDIVAVSRLKLTRVGDTLCEPRHPIEPVRYDQPPAVFSRAFLVENRAQEEKLGSALAHLCNEDPSLSVSHEGVVNGAVVTGLGVMHLDVTAERVKRMTGISCRLGPPRIPYRETLTRRVERVEGKQKKQTGGHGQFAVCYLDVQPLARGAGFVFEDAVFGGAVPRQFIPSVEKGVRRAMARGVLAGYPVEDVKVRLVDGKYHSVDSSDAAFQVAGYKAFLAAAEQAHPALLEPVMSVEIKVPAELVGDIIGDLNSRHGKVLGTDASNDWMVVTAWVPLSQLLDYEPSLTAMTSGRGSFTMKHDHYELVQSAAQQRIVEESGFQSAPEA